MPKSPGFKLSERMMQIDWRGWIALAWALWWGWAYALMVIEARSPLILSWLQQIGK
jgi:hypothetical protein